MSGTIKKRGNSWQADASTRADRAGLSLTLYEDIDPSPRKDWLIEKFNEGTHGKRTPQNHVRTRAGRKYFDLGRNASYRAAERGDRHAHRLLSQVLACAVKDGKLARNVADVHAPPKVEGEEVEILTADQVADVRAKLEGHSLLPIVELALATGMRRGELLGLQWGDLELDTATVRVIEASRKRKPAFGSAVNHWRPRDGRKD